MKLVRTQVRKWALSLAITLATIVGILGWHGTTPAQEALVQDRPITLDLAGLTVEPVADGVYTLIASTDFPPADFATTAICNVTVVVGSEGALMIDTFQNQALANLAFETVATLTDQPIRYVMNSHYHFDHSGGNAAADVQGLPILGRGPIREFMLTRNQELDPTVTPPDVVVNGSWDLWLGDRLVQLIEFDGHSGGTDLVAYIPDVDVLVTGDLLFAERIPFLADGNIRLWQDTLATLATTYETATVVPGHGAVGDRTGLLNLKGYLETLEALALQWKADGLSREEAIAQATLPEPYASYRFQGLFPGNIEVAYDQITLGQDDAASIEAYFQAQAPELKAL